MTIRDPSLRTVLKSPKLASMLDTLDARLAQTSDGNPAIRSSCKCSAKTRSPAVKGRLARRVRRARFEQPNTFENFDFTVSPRLPTAMLLDLAAWTIAST